MPRKEPSFAERLQTAAKAKEAQLEKLRAKAQANAAQSGERHAALMKIEEARNARIAERKSANRIAAERKAEERAAEKAREAQAAAEALARKEAELQAKAMLEKEQKAARDAKYAARKARRK